MFFLQTKEPHLRLADQRPPGLLHANQRAPHLLLANQRPPHVCVADQIQSHVLLADQTTPFSSCGPETNPHLLQSRDVSHADQTHLPRVSVADSRQFPRVAKQLRRTWADASHIPHPHMRPIDDPPHQVHGLLGETLRHNTTVKLTSLRIVITISE